MDKSRENKVTFSVNLLFNLSWYREKNVIDQHSGTLWEAVTLTMLGRDKKVLFELLKEAKEMAFAEEEGHTIIYHCVGPEWRFYCKFITLNQKNLDLLDLQEEGDLSIQYYFLVISLIHYIKM